MGFYFAPEVHKAVNIAVRMKTGHTPLICETEPSEI